MRKQWDTEKKLYTLCILTEDTPGILSQVARLFSRKGYNIESIVSGATDRPHTARISIELLADELVVNQLATQCRRLLGVQAVKIFDEETCIRREIALIKVRAADHGTRDEIIQMTKRVKLEETTFKDGMLRLSGEIELQILYASNEGGEGLYPVRTSVPVEVERELAGVDETQVEQYSLSVQIPQQTVSIKDSSQLEWRGTMNIELRLYSAKSEDILTELSVTPLNADVLEKLPGFAIYYVKPGDSLWQIGKKYYVSVGRIKEMNNMTEDEIKAGDKLLIVK